MVQQRWLDCHCCCPLYLAECIQTDLKVYRPSKEFYWPRVLSILAIKLLGSIWYRGIKMSRIECLTFDIDGTYETYYKHFISVYLFSNYQKCPLKKIYRMLFSITFVITFFYIFKIPQRILFFFLYYCNLFYKTHFISILSIVGTKPNINL